MERNCVCQSVCDCRVRRFRVPYDDGSVVCSLSRFYTCCLPLRLPMCSLLFVYVSPTLCLYSAHFSRPARWKPDTNILHVWTTYFPLKFYICFAYFTVQGAVRRQPGGLAASSLLAWWPDSFAPCRCGPVAPRSAQLLSAVLFWPTCLQLQGLMLPQ